MCQELQKHGLEKSSPMVKRGLSEYSNKIIQILDSEGFSGIEKAEIINDVVGSIKSEYEKRISDLDQQQQSVKELYEGFISNL